MAKQTTDPSKLLDEAYRIAEEEGISSLSIRKLAGTCGVSVGTVYTYYPSKGDLVAAVIDRFFRKTFYQDFCIPEQREGFIAFCRRFSKKVDTTLARFRSDWLAEIESLPMAERNTSHVREAEVMQHMAGHLATALRNDPAVTIDLEAGPNAEQIATFVLNSLISARLKNDRETLFTLMEHALYETPGLESRHTR